MEQSIEVRETENELVYIPPEGGIDAKRRRGSLEAEIILSALRKGLTVRISNAVVNGDLTLDSETIGSRIHMEQCDFLGLVKMGYCHFAKPVWFVGCRFAQAVDLTSAIFGHGLRGSECMFASPVDLSGCTVAHLMCERAQFADRVSFVSISINGILQMSGAHFRKGLSVNSGHITGDVRLEDSLSNGNIDFVSSEIGGTVLLSRARLRQDTLFYGAQIDGHMVLRGAVFGAKVDFARIFVGQTFLSDDAVFEGSASFNSMRVKDAAAFDKVAFRQNADFVSAHFGGRTSFIDTVFEGGVSFDACKVEADLDMEGTRVSEKFYFASAQVTRSLFFSKAIVNGEVIFAYTEIGGVVAFTDCCFLRTAHFDHMRIRGPVNFDRAKFAKDANFDHFDVGGNARLRGATFNASLSLQRAQIGGSLDAGPITASRDESAPAGELASTMRTTFTGPASFNAVTIQGNAIFADVQVESDMSLDGATIRGNALFQSTRFDGPFRSVGARISGDMLFTSCEFQDTAKLSRVVADGFIGCKVTQFKRSVTFADSTAREGLSLIGNFFFDEVTFRRASFDTISLASEKAEDATITKENGHSIEIKNHFMGSIDLRGMIYNEPIPWQEWTELVDRMSPYDKQPFVHLEELLRRVGRDEVADRVYYKRRTREFELFKKRRPLVFLVDRFLCFLTGYGVKLRRLVYALLICVAAGTAVFHQQGSVRAISPQVLASEPDWFGANGSLSTIDSFWFSAATLLPVKLGIETRFQASSGYLWKAGSSGFGVRYTTVEVLLIIAGWVLIPIGLAGLTGWLKR